MQGNTSKSAQSRETAATRLLVWYDGHRRALPWRARPGEAPDPYAVWLSEIMLQQTTVAAVKAYYVSFLAVWPTVRGLAAASVEDVMKRWAGLGYYSRARNLHACARAIVANHGGVFPDTEVGLRALPGIGAYTAAAVASIAFGQRAVVIDGNVERVIARYHGVEAPVATVKPLIRQLADAQTPDERPGDYAQAMMDLGATLCTPRKPACVICPIASDCVARIGGLQAVLPAKGAKAARPTRYGSVFYTRCAGAVLVRTRPPKGLLGGMTEFPGSTWDTDGDPEGLEKPIAALYRKLRAPVTHGFTHFELVLTVHVAELPSNAVAPDGSRWIKETDMATEALPSLMRKVANAVAGESSDER